MITDVAKAIKTHYDTNGATLQAQLTGGLFFQSAGPNTSVPYGVWFWIGSSIDEEMGGQADRIEKADIQFSLFSQADDGGVEVAGLTDKLTALYDWANVAFTATSAFTAIAFERNGSSSITLIDDVWQSVMNYTVWFSH